MALTETQPDKGNMTMKSILITGVSAVGLLCNIASAAHATKLQCVGSIKRLVMPGARK
jgi:hypothetical protein